MDTDLLEKIAKITGESYIDTLYQNGVPETMDDIRERVKLARKGEIMKIRKKDAELLLKSLRTIAPAKIASMHTEIITRLLKPVLDYEQCAQSKANKHGIIVERPTKIILEAITQAMFATLACIQLNKLHTDLATPFCRQRFERDLQLIYKQLEEIEINFFKLAKTINV